MGKAARTNEERGRERKRKPEGSREEAGKPAKSVRDRPARIGGTVLPYHHWFFFVDVFTEGFFIVVSLLLLSRIFFDSICSDVAVGYGNFGVMVLSS